MAQQVKASQQAQRDWVANVSHDLETPLTSTQGFSQAILDGTATDPGEALRVAGIIHHEAGRSAVWWMTCSGCADGCQSTADGA